MRQSSNPILLYDGVCGLCNRLVQFTLRHDHRDIFRFASLQSSLAADILQRHGKAAGDLDTFYAVLNRGGPDEHVLARSDAAVYVLETLGGGWGTLGRLGGFLPRQLRDALYNLVARNRYRMFGKLEICPLPDPRYRHKFLDG